MSEDASVEFPTETVAGAAGPHAAEAFALLADETRLAILLVLWELYDPHADDNTAPFSEIFRRVDYDDPGSFRYHLKRLRGQFVRQAADGEGYGLRVSALKFIHAVIAGAGVQDATREPTVIDQPCPFCDAPTAISYRDGLVVQTCTECEGVTEGNVTGFLSTVPFDPAGLSNRTIEEIRAASRVAAWRQTQIMFEGLCPACSGSVESWLDCCPDHDPTSICEQCGMRLGAWARFQCRVCKNHNVSSPKALALFHPAVLAFYDAHGVATRIHADNFESVRRVFGLMDDHEMDIHAGESPRVTVTATRDGESIQLTFDEAARVVGVRR